MKKSMLLSAIAMLALVQAAAAQDYFIRVAYNTNLRASYSLDAEILETARAGTVLRVVAEFDRWLKIDRSGGAAWMANWVSYARVDSSGEQAPPTAALENPADNCCQIDRQCTSEGEWQMGFWAFAQGQCPLPQRHIDGIIVEGSDAFASRVREALDVLRTRAPNWQAYAINGLDKIRQVSENIGVGVDTAKRRFDLTASHAFLDQGNWSTDDAIIWLAGVFVHEACHVYRHEAGFPYSEPVIRFREEAACLQVQVDALTAIDPQRRFNVYLSGLIQDFLRRGHRI